MRNSHEFALEVWIEGGHALTLTLILSLKEKNVEVMADGIVGTGF
jgi:hypothetical protein